jgi:hypothetical protein
VTNKIQLSVDSNGRPIFVVAGDNPAEFEQNVINLFGTAAYETIIGWADGRIQSMELAGAEAVAAAFPGAKAVAYGDNKAAQDVQLPKDNDGPFTETDRWGNKFTYNLPGAPVGPNGPKVLKEGTSKAGKPYKAWWSPTDTPYAFRNKIQKDENESPEWIK